MENEKVIQIIRKTIQESMRQFHITYLDTNGFPHSSYMGFAHFNKKNFSLIMLVPRNSRKAAVMFEHPWVEAVFHSKDYRYVSKFYGNAFLTSSQKSVEKLLQSYPFLDEFFPNGGTGAVLLQLQTQMIEVEWLKQDQKWHSRANFMLENGELKETKEPVIEGPKVAAQEKDVDVLDRIRREITKNHGEMLMSLLSGDFEQAAEYVADDFGSDKYPDKAAYIQSLREQFEGKELGSSDFNWGLRDFEHNKDGTMNATYFLDISRNEEPQLSIKQQEQWVNDNTTWKLLKIM